MCLQKSDRIDIVLEPAQRLRHASPWPRVRSLPKLTCASRISNSLAESKVAVMTAELVGAGGVRT